MLADSTHIAPQIGRLDQDIHLPFTAKLALIDFITEELPRWRDNPDRPKKDSETALTEYLCGYLNSAVYHTKWSHIQFQTETTDETHSGRKIDLAVRPRAAVIIIEGRRHTQFDTLFPIECKRLPTPKGKDRDEHEYVISQFSTTGGIQRFKFGFHGAAHTFAAMIAYVQKHTCSQWFSEVNHWIRDLAAEPSSAWNDSEQLQSLSKNLDTKVHRFKSKHDREDDLGRLELHHLWIEMK